MRVVSLALVGFVLSACGSKTAAPPPPPPPAVPAAPTGLTVTATDSSATLQWTASPGAVDYAILRAPGGTTNFTAVGTTASTSASDSALTANTAYVYAVNARNASGASANATVNVTTSPAPPTAVTASASNHHVTLSWTAPAGTVSGYRVLRSTTSGGPYTSAGTSAGTSFTDTTLANGTTYYYVVHAMGGSGESGDSGAVSAKPFIEICTLDAAAFAVNTYDGQASGNVAPKRSFGWNTGIANGTGIATDGANLYIASQYTQSINVYPRTWNSGSPAQAGTIALPAQPTAIALDTTNKEIFVAAGDTVYVYSVNGTPTFARSLKTGIGVNGLGIDLVNLQLIVVQANTIVLYNRTDRTDTGLTVTPLKTVMPTSPSPSVTTISSTTVLYGGAYDASNDSIWVVWDNANVNPTSPKGFAASYAPRSATPGTAVYSSGFGASFTSYIHPRGIAVDGTGFMWITTADFAPVHGNDAIYRFNRTTGGLVKLISGSTTGLYNPTALYLDSANSEVWVVNGQNGAAAYSTAATSAYHGPPLRSLDNMTAGLLDPLGFAVDRVHDELMVLTNGPDQSAQIFARQSTGSPTPLATIGGPLNNSTLSGKRLQDLAADEAHGEYWINLDGGSLAVFSRTQTGDVAPVRAIAQSSSAIAGFNGMAFDSKAGNIVVGSIDPATSSGNLLSWPSTANGTVAPSITAVLPISVGNTSSLSFDFAHDQLYGAALGYVNAFPRAFPAGSLSPTSSFRSAATPIAVDGEGGEIYGLTTTASGDAQIVVFPVNATGIPTPTRVLQGAATKLNRPKSLAICN